MSDKHVGSGSGFVFGAFDPDLGSQLLSIGHNFTVNGFVLKASRSPSSRGHVLEVGMWTDVSESSHPPRCASVGHVPSIQQCVVPWLPFLGVLGAGRHTRRKCDSQPGACTFRGGDVCVLPGIEWTGLYPLLPLVFQRRCMVLPQYLNHELCVLVSAPPPISRDAVFVDSRCALERRLVPYRGATHRIFFWHCGQER